MYIMTFSSLILSYNLPGALREWRVDTMCNFGGFFPPCCAWKSAVYVSPVHGLRDQCSAVAFPVEDMQQAGSAGSSMAPSAGCSMAPSELLPSLWRGAGAVQAPVSVSSACGRHKWPGSTGLLWAWVEFLALPKLLPLLCQPAVFLCFHGPAAKLRRCCSSVFCLSQAAP